MRGTCALGVYVSYVRDVDTQFFRFLDYAIPQGNPFLTRTHPRDGTYLGFRESMIWADVKRKPHAYPWGSGVSIYSLLFNMFCSFFSKSFLFYHFILIRRCSFATCSQFAVLDWC